MRHACYLAHRTVNPHNGEPETAPLRPQVLLGSFRRPSGSRLGVRQVNRLPVCARPEKLAKEGGFYEAPFLHGSGIDPAFLEQELAGLEAEAASTISSWIRLIETGSRIVQISEVDRQTIANYIAVQALRTSEQRVALSQAVGTKMSARDVQSFHVGMLLDDSVVPAIAEAIGDFIWMFGWNDSGSPFYTSDHPVAARVHPKKRCIHPAQLRTQGAELMLPLSATLIFYGYERSYFRRAEQFDGCVSPVPFTTVFVEAENQCQVGHSRRFVFCDRDAFDFARAFCAKNPAVRDPNRSRFVSQLT